MWNADYLPMNAVHMWVYHQVPVSCSSFIKAHWRKILVTLSASCVASAVLQRRAPFWLTAYYFISCPESHFIQAQVQFALRLICQHLECQHFLTALTTQSEYTDVNYCNVALFILCLDRNNCLTALHPADLWRGCFAGCHLPGVAD